METDGENAPRRTLQRFGDAHEWVTGSGLVLHYNASLCGPGSGPSRQHRLDSGGILTSVGSVCTVAGCLLPAALT